MLFAQRILSQTDRRMLSNFQDQEPSINGVAKGIHKEEEEDPWVELSPAQAQCTDIPV